MTTTVADGLLRASAPKSLTNYWRGTGLDAVVESVLTSAEQTGHALPAVRYDRSFVFPVVTIDHDAVAQRRVNAQAPTLDRRFLRELALAGREAQPPPAVSMQAFVTVDRLAAAAPTLGRLAGWARVIAAVPTWTQVASLAATRCDYYGHTVVATDGEVAQVLVNGHRGAKPGASTERDPWLLRWEEQLFDLAIRAGAVDWPGGPPRP